MVSNSSRQACVCEAARKKKVMPARGAASSVGWCLCRTHHDDMHVSAMAARAEEEE